MEGEVGESVMALTGAWGKWSPSAGCGGPGWSGRTNCPESGCCGRSRKTSVLTHLKNLLDLKWYEEMGVAVCLSGLTPGVNSLTLSGVPIGQQTPVVARMSEGFREPPVVGNREEGQGGKTPKLN